MYICIYIYIYIYIYNETQYSIKHNDYQFAENDICEWKRRCKPRYMTSFNQKVKMFIKSPIFIRIQRCNFVKTIL